ncbi:MAG: MarR family winged helix-turn-helix transcriptional regulator [Myxococcota bacterium]
MSPSSSGARLNQLLTELMGALHRHSTGESLRIMVEEGITLPQLVALQRLQHGGPTTVSGLHDCLNLSASATSHLVDRLVERGFVERTEDPADRRQKRVAIAPAGGGLIDRLARSRVAELDAAVSSLDPELVARLFGVFEQVIARLNPEGERR